MNKDNNNKNNVDSSGVYFSFLVSEKDAIKLTEFGTHQLGLDMTNSGNEYESRKHATVFASRERNLDVNYQQIVDDKKDDTIVVSPIGWKLIKSHNTGKNCLALLVYSEELIKAHEEIKSITGLNHAFSTFITHVSLHYDFKMTPERLKDMPLPQFNIHLDRLFTKEYKNTDNYKASVNKGSIDNKNELVSNIQNIRDKFLNTQNTNSVKLKAV